MKKISLSILALTVSNTIACSGGNTILSPSTGEGNGRTVVEVEHSESLPVNITEPSYLCSDREAYLAEYLSQPTDSRIVTLPSGEKVYIDWLGRVYHVEGPECQ